jgi:hypothetical protein
MTVRFIGYPLVPAKAGTQRLAKELDARLRGHERTLGDNA